MPVVRKIPKQVVHKPRKMKQGVPQRGKSLTSNIPEFRTLQKTLRSNDSTICVRLETYLAELATYFHEECENSRHQINGHTFPHELRK